MKKIITLLTDFGLSDSYIGSMKGVILSINPEVHLIDITHDIRPQSVLSAAFILSTVYTYFPKGSIHLAVVDPGVGTERRAICVATKDYHFVGPDNGVFTYIFHHDQDSKVYELTNKRYFRETISLTFHGRDIFAPVAAHLSMGLPPSKIGTIVEDYESIDLLEPAASRGILKGVVVHQDRFGNLITNISLKVFSDFVGNGSYEIVAGSWRTHLIRETYAQVAPGELLLVFGSAGYLEISENMGNASARLGLDVGSPIKIRKI